MKEDQKIDSPEYPNVSSDNITSLNENEIFVFGSNTGGYHGAGAAYLANQKFGALWGKGIGLQGQSYAIPTKDSRIRTLEIKYIAFFVDRFIDHALRNPLNDYLVTEIGCGLAGYTPEVIAPLFRESISLSNVYLPIRFLEEIHK
jgi:hypothetical protein